MVIIIKNNKNEIKICPSLWFLLWGCLEFNPMCNLVMHPKRKLTACHDKEPYFDPKWGLAQPAHWIRFFCGVYVGVS